MDAKTIICKIKPILAENNIKRAELVGSFASGEATSKSDIDLLIEPNETISLFGLIGLRNKLVEATKRSVDLITYNSINPKIRKSILTHKVLVL